MTVATRHRILPGREGAAIRDLDKFARAQVPIRLVKFTAVYTEPMTFAYPYEPEGVLLIRAREDESPETEVASWVMANYVYKSGQVVINSVGLGLDTKYRMTFACFG